MPVKKCTKDNKPGFQWGDQTCYTYEPGNEEQKREARDKAERQGEAIRASGYSENEA